MLTSMIMSMQATNAVHRNTNALFGANQQVMNLANSVTGAESPQDLMRIQQTEQALMFQGMMAKANLEAAWLMQESAQRLQQRNLEQKRRLMDAGALFV